MIRRLLTSLKKQLKIGQPKADSQLRPAAHRMASQQPGRSVRARKAPADTQPEVVEFSPDGPGTIEDGGPGKNVLTRSRYVREETGTHETLKILDDSLIVPPDEGSFDPYNTGRFDMSKSWTRTSRK